MSNDDWLILGVCLIGWCGLVFVILVRSIS